MKKSTNSLNQSTTELEEQKSKELHRVGVRHSLDSQLNGYLSGDILILGAIAS